MDVMWEIQSYLIIRKFASKVKLFSGRNGFTKGIKRIENLLEEKGEVLPFPVFQREYSLKTTSFLHYYQVISAIPGHLLTKAKSKDLTSESISP